MLYALCDSQMHVVSHGSAATADSCMRVVEITHLILEYRNRRRFLEKLPIFRAGKKRKEQIPPGPGQTFRADFEWIMEIMPPYLIKTGKDRKGILLG